MQKTSVVHNPNYRPISIRVSKYIKSNAKARAATRCTATG
jgi:hypothetical protein